MSNTLERINKVFRIVFDNKDLVVMEKTSAEDIEEWDSLQHINIISMLEKEFNIEFDIDQIISLENVGDMVRTIEKLTELEKNTR